MTDKLQATNNHGINERQESISLPEILFITSFPPRECGIATYSQDLIKSLNNKFGNSFSIKICALERENEKHEYVDDIKFVHETANPESYNELGQRINQDQKIKVVLIQHEFGFFYRHENEFLNLLRAIKKPIVIVFHTVLPRPDEVFRKMVTEISNACESIVVMTNNSAAILERDYQVPKEKINVIPHGTHLVPHMNRDVLKEKDGFTNRKVLSTFGLLSSGKGIETTLHALPSIIEKNPDVLFLVIGKTHPSVVKEEGEKYRNMLLQIVDDLNLHDHVKFINRYLPLNELLEYLQLTDIYLFTSKDPNQAVSGTFSYAISCGCPIISTPMPHAKEVLREDAGVIFDFGDSTQLANAANRLLADEQLRKNMSSNGLHRITSTAWENSAVSYAMLFERIVHNEIPLKFSLPPINLNHIVRMTSDFGMFQFSQLNRPDPASGYTLDDNARALIAMCQHYDLSKNKNDIAEVRIYLNFIRYCQQPDGNFLNYVDEQKNFTEQNHETNLEDSNGRAMWALGHLLAMNGIMPADLTRSAAEILEKAMAQIETMHSTRAMAFAIKGLYYYNREKKSDKVSSHIKLLADRLLQMYRHESTEGWEWFESYLTYANSVLPEAMLCAYLDSDDKTYKEAALRSFKFLLSKIFDGNKITVISNKRWMKKGDDDDLPVGGEQPIDVAYTILSLSRFYEVFNEEEYLDKMESAFNWFLGDNHLKQIIYNPCTGGSYDGLEENYVNLNQGAESTVSYLMARLVAEKYFSNRIPVAEAVESQT